MFLLQFVQFTLLLGNILPESFQISVPDGHQLVQSIENLTKNCDQSKNYIGILDAIHHSLDLQKRLKELEQQVSNLEYTLSNDVGGKSRREITASSSDVNNVYFSVVRSEVLRCHSCPVTYAHAHVNPDNVVNLSTGEFTAPVSGDYYFQFHGMVEKGHEARVVMMANNRVLAHMYDKDYSGNNQRFAMFGQSIIANLQIGDKFKVVLEKGSLGVPGGSNNFISFLGHLLGSTHFNCLLSDVYNSFLSLSNVSSNQNCHC